MAILLGGRSAEMLVFGQAGSSASGDSRRWGRVAHHMARAVRMSIALGPSADRRRHGDLRVSVGERFPARGLAVTRRHLNELHR